MQIQILIVIVVAGSREHTHFRAQRKQKCTVIAYLVDDDETLKVHIIIRSEC